MDLSITYTKKSITVADGNMETWYGKADNIPVTSDKMETEMDVLVVD